MTSFRSLAGVSVACLALGACTAPSSYMGISFAAGDLQELARRAQAGDKQARLDLGIAYEEGRGVAVQVRPRSNDENNVSGRFALRDNPTSWVRYVKMGQTPSFLDFLRRT